MSGLSCISNNKLVREVSGRTSCQTLGHRPSDTSCNDCSNSNQLKIQLQLDDLALANRSVHGYTILMLTGTEVLHGLRDSFPETPQLSDRFPQGFSADKPGALAWGLFSWRAAFALQTCWVNGLVILIFGLLILGRHLAIAAKIERKSKLFPQLNSQNLEQLQFV